jgi:hypothetical protein
MDGFISLFWRCCLLLLHTTSYHDVLRLATGTFGERVLTSPRHLHHHLLRHLPRPRLLPGSSTYVARWRAAKCGLELYIARSAVRDVWPALCSLRTTTVTRSRLYLPCFRIVSVSIHIDPYRSVSIRIDPYRSISIHIDPYRSVSCATGVTTTPRSKVVVVVGLLLLAAGGALLLGVDVHVVGVGLLGRVGDL